MAPVEVLQLAVEAYVAELDDDEFARLVAIARPNLAAKQGGFVVNAQSVGRDEFVHHPAVFCMTCRHHRDSPCSKWCWSDDRASWGGER